MGSSTLQALSHPVERGDVGVARPHLAAHRDTVPVNHHPQHHLFAIAAVVLALAVLAEGVATVAGEEQRGGVEEHQVERAEQVAALSEQLLLDEVFDAPRRWRIGLAFAERLADPRSSRQCDGVWNALRVDVMHRGLRMRGSRPAVLAGFLRLSRWGFGGTLKQGVPDSAPRGPETETEMGGHGASMVKPSSLSTHRAFAIVVSLAQLQLVISLPP